MSLVRYQQHIIIMLLRPVRFVHISMRPIPHTFAYIPESKLLETDGAQWTIFRMGPVHTWDNGPGVSGTEPECTARYQAYCTPEQEYDPIAFIGIGSGAYGTPGED